MATFAEQINLNVDRLIAEGAIASGMRDKYIELFTTDPKATEKFATVLSLDKDYTYKRKQDSDRERQREAEWQVKQAEVAREHAALKQWETDTKAELERLKTFEVQTPGMLAKMAAYEQKLTDYDMLKDVTVPSVPTVPTPPQGEPAMTTPTQQLPADYLKRDDAANAIRDLMIMQGNLQAIAGEHYALYGKPLTDNLMAEAMNAGVQDIRQFWESKYNVAGKRAEVQQATYNAELERVRAEERAKVMAELAVDPSRVTGQGGFNPQPGSPLFDRFASRATAAALDGTVKPLSELPPELRPEPVTAQNRVDRAMAHFAANYNADGSPRLGGGPAQ